MFKNNKIRTQRQQNRVVINTLIFVLITIPFLLTSLDKQLSLNLSKYNNLFFIGISLIILFKLFSFLFRHKIYKGMKYALYHYIISNKVRKALLDARYYNNRLYLNNELADLPIIKLYFSKDMFEGKLLIENIKINKDFDNVNIASALKNYVVERHYLSNNENFFIFEIYDADTSQQLTFNNLADFKDYSSRIDDYSLFIDKVNVLPLSSMLLTGGTGAGKSYASMNFILQMIYKNIDYNLYYADPKNSSLAVIGNKNSPDNTAAEIDDIISLLKKFNKEMEKRKVTFNKLLSSKLDSTYADFNLNPHILIFDEFTSFQTVLKTRPKKERDEVESLLANVVLQGRQLGFFFFMILQQAGSTHLPTYLRENLPAKFLLALGQMENETKRTTFGPGVSAPDKSFEIGEGIFISANLAMTQPKICHFPYLNFDILDAVI